MFIVSNFFKPTLILGFLLLFFLDLANAGKKSTESSERTGEVAGAS